MALLKNLAPYDITATCSGVSDTMYTVGDEFIGKGRYGDGVYRRIEIRPGTSSITGRALTLAVPYNSSGFIRNTFTFDYSDSGTTSDQMAMKSAAAITMGSMMTAVTHFMWALVKGYVAALQCGATTSYFRKGEYLYVTTTDKQWRNVRLTAGQNTAVSHVHNQGPFAIAMASMAITDATTVTKKIMLLGKHI